MKGNGRTAGRALWTPEVWTIQTKAGPMLRSYDLLVVLLKDKETKVGATSFWTRT